MLLHSRDETLTCHECGDEFSILVHLKRHMKKHEIGDGEGSQVADDDADRDQPPVDVAIRMLKNKNDDDPAATPQEDSRAVNGKYNGF